MNWRRLFPIIFLFSMIDGFISNRFYPAKLPFLYKDIFILMVYVLFFIRRESGKRWVPEFARQVGPGVWYLIIALVFLGMLQIFNRNVPNLPVGVLGFKTMFFYWPLAILAYAYVDSLERLERLMKVIVYFSIPICIFGIVQFFQRPDFMIKLFGEGFSRAITITGGARGSGSFMRVFGTFASSGQLTHFLVINAMLIFGLLFGAAKKSEKILLIGCLLLNHITLLCTGSRAGLLLLFPTTFLFVILCRWLWRSFFIILLLGISLNFGFHYLGKAVLGRFETVKDVKMLRSRSLETTTGMFKNYLEEHPFGKGMGTATSAARYLFKERNTELEFIENYPAKLQCEMGIVGVILFYTLLLSLAIHWALHWIRFIERKTYVIIIACTSYCWTMFAYALFGVVDTPPIGIFLWAEIGIVAKLVTLQSNDEYPLST